MNKIVISSLLCLFFIACQNTPKSAADAPLISPEVSSKATTPTTLAAPVAVTPESIGQASASLAAGVKLAQTLRTQADALPDKIKKENSAAMDNIYATLEGLIEKQTMMLNEIRDAGNPQNASQEGGGLSSAQMQEYTESAARYAQDAQAIQEAIKKWSDK